MKTYDEYYQTLKDSMYTILSSTKCSDGTAWITLSQPNINSDKCEVVFNMITLEKGTQVHLSILCNEENGWDSVPSKSDLLGERVGSLNLNVVLKQLPSIYTDKVKAESYLARNPDMIIGKLSNILNLQGNIIEKQQNIISDVDRNMEMVYDNTTTKTRKFINLVFGTRAKKWGLKGLAKLLGE